MAIFFSEASAPVTLAPSRAIGSHRSPPPQPMSRKAQTFERPAPGAVAAELGEHLFADIGEPDGIELVQRPELAVRVPPLFGHGGEAGDFVLVDGGRF